MPRGKKKDDEEIKKSVVEEVPEVAEPKATRGKKIKFKVLFGFLIVNGVSVFKGEYATVSGKQFEEEFAHLVEKEIIEEVY